MGKDKDDNKSDGKDGEKGGRHGRKTTPVTHSGIARYRIAPSPTSTTGD